MPYRTENASPPWVVVATQTPWDEIPRMRHQVTRALSRDYQVLYITFPTDWRRKYKTANEDVEPNITVLRPSNLFTFPERLVAKYPPAQFLEVYYLRRTLMRRLSAIRSQLLGVVNFDHRHHWIHDRRLFHRSVYICNDDHSLFAPSPSLSRRCLDQMQAAARSADAALAVSENVARKLAVGAKAQVFLPGHDLPVCETPTITPYTPGDVIRIGFMGTIDSRVDITWVERATAQPDFEWHMIGPVACPHLLARLQSKPKVRLYPPVTGQSLMNWLRDKNVLTVPYSLPPEWMATVATPNKLPAYFASGKPVVVSDLPHLADWARENVYAARDADEFIAQIRCAAAENSIEKAMRRIDIAREFTWANRIAQVQRLLELSPLKTCKF